jgi:hypothetical protein
MMCAPLVTVSSERGERAATAKAVEACESVPELGSNGMLTLQDKDGAHLAVPASAWTSLTRRLKKS